MPPLGAYSGPTYFAQALGQAVTDLLRGYQEAPLRAAATAQAMAQARLDELRALAAQRDLERAQQMGTVLARLAAKARDPEAFREELIQQLPGIDPKYLSVFLQLLRVLQPGPNPEAVKTAIQAYHRAQAYALQEARREIEEDSALGRALKKDPEALQWYLQYRRGVYLRGLAPTWGPEVSEGLGWFRPLPPPPQSLAEVLLPPPGWWGTSDPLITQQRTQQFWDAVRQYLDLPRARELALQGVGAPAKPPRSFYFFSPSHGLFRVDEEPEETPGEAE